MDDNALINQNMLLQMNNRIYTISIISFIELIYYYSIFFNTFNFMYYINIIFCILGFNGARFLNKNRIYLYSVYHNINTAIVIYNSDNETISLFLFLFNIYVTMYIYQLNLYINDINNIILNYS